VFAGKQAGTISNTESGEGMDKKDVTELYSPLPMHVMEKLKWVLLFSLSYNTRTRC